MGDKLKYAHLSEPDSTWAPIQEAVDQQMKAFWSLPPDQFDQAWRSMPAALPEGTPMGQKIEDMKIPARDGHQLNIRIYRDPAPDDKNQKPPLLIIFHGGGWMLGDHKVEEGVARFAVEEAGVVVVDVDYRLSPGSQFPIPLYDCYDAFKWCKQNSSTLGIDPTQIIVCGSSAGGNLTAAVAQMTRDQKESGIIGQLLNMPVLCHPNHWPKDNGYEYNSWTQNANAPILTSEIMIKCWDTYYPAAGKDVYASPFLAQSLQGLPSTLIQIPGLDVLRDEGFAYADRLEKDGVAVEIQTWPGLPHGFYTVPTLPATTQYYKKAAAWIAALTARERQSR